MDTTEVLSDYESPLILTLNSSQHISPIILLKKHVFTLNKNTEGLLSIRLWTVAGEGHPFPVFNPTTRIETVETFMQLEYNGHKNITIELIF